MTPLQLRIRRAVLELQAGEVVSYREVARRCGNPRWARAVGGLLAEHGDDLPWWRVVLSDGSLGAPNRTDQRRRLRAEGVEVEDWCVVGGVP